MNVRRVAIAGAGMAGTSVACALVARGFAGEIVLLDERARSDAARTWCWWDVPGIAFREFATLRYPAWRVVNREREVVRGSSQHPYLCLSGAEFYAAADLALGRGPQRVGNERVVRIEETGRAAIVHCASGLSIEADIAIDARGAQPAAAGLLVQRFVGQFVRTRDPVFEPGVATLMDFRAGSESPVHFTYVLPFTRDTALVEDTVFTKRATDDTARRANIGRYVEEILHTRIVACDAEEHGAIALDPASPTRPSRRVAALGAAGGAVRPSSGYAFVRTQRHASALADAISSLRPLPMLAAKPHQRMLDGALLALLACGVLRAPRFFPALFASTDADVLARFMSDASAPSDDARMLAALLPRAA